MKVYKLVIAIVIIIAIIFGLQKLKPIRYEAVENIVTVQSTKSELEKIMEEENFKKSTILRARKISSDNKRKSENEKNEKILLEEKAKYEKILEDEKIRHESVTAEIEKENESIRTEELELVSVNNTFLK